MLSESFCSSLEEEFKRNANAEIAGWQKAYMKNQFAFFGIQTPLRRSLQKPFLEKQFLPSKTEAQKIIRTLWQKPERDFQYFAQELAYKYVKQIEKEDIALFEYIIANKSWWDTVDFIATKLVAAYFKKFPQEIEQTIKKWIASNNMWLQRSALLFQLHYKKDLDTERLVEIIQPLLGSKEFFINKAIGWVLRHYSRTNPEWVIFFCEKTTLNSLSRREALRLIKNGNK